MGFYEANHIKPTNSTPGLMSYWFDGSIVDANLPNSSIFPPPRRTGISKSEIGFVTWKKSGWYSGCQRTRNKWTGE